MESFSLYFFDCFLTMPFSSSSRALITWMLDPLLSPHISIYSGSINFFFSLFSVHCSDWIISVVLSSSLLSVYCPLHFVVEPIYCIFNFDYCIFQPWSSHLVSLFISAASVLRLFFHLFQCACSCSLKHLCHITLTLLLSWCWHLLILFFPSVWDLLGPGYNEWFFLSKPKNLGNSVLKLRRY